MPLSRHYPAVPLSSFCQAAHPVFLKTSVRSTPDEILQFRPKIQTVEKPNAAAASCLERPENSGQGFAMALPPTGQTFPDANARYRISAPGSDCYLYFLPSNGRKSDFARMLDAGCGSHRNQS